VVPFRAAEARLHWGTNLVRADARQEAAVVLGEGLSTAEQLGATWLSDQIRTRAVRARLPLAGATQRGPHDRAGLTDREYEVLQLVVTGMTNTQVGDELYMSPKTVSVHVSRILQKLAVANRTELASVAHRRGLVHP
jgi:DNA-binding NarL/FixJ family response regulator